MGSMQCKCDSLNSKLEVWWDVCRAYDDSLNSMLEVWWDICTDAVYMMIA